MSRVRKSLVSSQALVEAIAEDGICAGYEIHNVFDFCVGGEAIVLGIGVQRTTHWLKLYKKFDFKRKYRIEYLNQQGVMPFPIEYSEYAKGMFLHLEAKYLEKINDATIAENVPHLSWKEFLDTGGAGPQGVLYAISLANQIEDLESLGGCHRDLSSSNIFLNKNSFDVVIIDWDQFYHSALSPPTNLKRGTPCYKPSFRSEYETYGDRYALAILITEFLSVQKPCNDSSFFSQGELKDAQDIKVAGKILEDRQVFSFLPNTLEMRNLLIKTLTAKSFSAMTPPCLWRKALSKLLEAPIYHKLRNKFTVSKKVNVTWKRRNEVSITR